MQNVFNEKCFITVEEPNSLERKFHVEYSVEDVNSAFEKAIDVVCKNVQLKGFRKGKVPKNIIKNNCIDQIKNVSSNILVNECFSNICNKYNIQPISQPRIENINFNTDGTFSCDIFVDIKPVIVPEGYFGLQLSKQNIDINSIFDKLLNNLKNKYSSIVKKDFVESGDTVEVDFEVKYKDEEITAGKSHSFVIKNEMEPPFGNNLIGMKVGEVKNFLYIIPDGFKKYVGENANIQITLKNVTTKVLATNDEIINYIGVQSYEELEDLIMKQAIQEGKNTERKILEEEVIDKLLEMHKFDIPKKLIDDEINYVSKKFNINNVENDDNFYNYLKNMAIRNIKRIFILDAIYEAEPSIAVKKEEFEELIKQEALNYGIDEFAMKDRLKKKNFMAGVLGVLRQKKVMDLIITNAQ